MAMKRIIILFLAAVCTIMSCDKFKAEDNTEQEKRIEEAQNTALKAIDEASSSAIAAAKQAITTATAKAVEGAGKDISVVINDAKKEIQSAVESSVRESIDTKLNAFNEKLCKANRFAEIAVLIALGAILLSFFFFILLLRRTSHDSIVENVVKSRRVKRKTEEIIRDYTNAEARPQVENGISKDDVVAAVREYLNNPDFKQIIAKLYPQVKNGISKDDVEAAVREYLNSPDFKQIIASLPPTQGNTSGQPQTNPGTKVELFAKDSCEKCLTGVSPVYQQGKSIYRLVLTSSDSQNAEISICVDKDEVKRRILKSSNDLLEPVCKVERQKSNPDDLTTINAKSGKAEKISGDTWRITEQITVELS